MDYQNQISCLYLIFYKGLEIKIRKVKKMKKETEKVTIWIVGDSTISSFQDAYYYPRYGWGTKLEQYFDKERFHIKNLALSGRSSLSFLKEKQYETLMEGMKAGDFLLIGFGHNDEKMEAARFTSPVGDEKTEGSFAYSLFQHYIVPAKEKGCQAILCTPIVRRSVDGEWKLEHLHCTVTNGTFAGGDYPQVIRQMGERLAIPVVDMTTLTKNVYDKLGPEQTLYLHAWNSSKAISVDNTHTNEWGAFYNAWLVAKAIQDLKIKGLSEYVLTSKMKQAPEKEILCSNPNYREVIFQSNLEQSKLWKDFGCFKGTVFGSIGEEGVLQKGNFILEPMKEERLHMAVLKDKGKIAGTEDGIAFYYTQIPVDASFCLSAKITIQRIEWNDQVSFGLMVRDDVYIDTWIADGLGDYVAAGPLKLAQMNGGTAWNNFARKSGLLIQGKVLKQKYQVGDIVEAEIRGTQDGYVCRFGEEEEVSGGFDFKLTSIDPKHVYVGMFAARNCDVIFSDVKLIVNGKKRGESDR